MTMVAAPAPATSRKSAIAPHGSGSNRQTQRRSNNNNNAAFQMFLLTLIFLAVCLLFSAMYLSRQLDLQHGGGGGASSLSLSSNKAGGGDIDERLTLTFMEKDINDIDAKETKNSRSSYANNRNQKSNNNDNASAKQMPPATSKNVDFSSFKQYPNDRIYCMIPFIWNPQIYSAIMSTWGQRCDMIHFLTDAMVLVDGGELNGDYISFAADTTTENDDNDIHNVGGDDSNSDNISNNDKAVTAKPYWEYPPNTFPSNIKFINMTRSWEDCPETANKRTGKLEKKVCRHIWEKMWRSWVYVAQHHLHDAEWFCKVDYDTFFFPDNLKYFVRDVKGWDGINEYHYFGHVIQHRSRKDRPMVVGASACWSQKTLRDIAQVYRDMPKGSKLGERGKCEDRAHATEEVSTSLCLKDHLNIDPEPARDDQLREYITIDKYPLVLGWNRTEQGEWWYWRGKPADAGQLENTIARRPIGLHKYKTPEEILRLWEEFYYPAENNEALEKLGRERKHGVVAKRFVMEVRKAMGID